MKLAGFLFGVLLAGHGFGAPTDGKAIFKNLVFNQDLASAQPGSVKLNARISKLFSETYRTVISQSEGKVSAEDVKRALREVGDVYAEKIEKKNPEFFMIFADRITSGDPDMVDLAIRELVDVLEEVANNRTSLVASHADASSKSFSTRRIGYPDQLAVVLMHVVEAAVAYDVAVAVDTYVAVNTHYWTSSVSLNDVNSLERDSLIMDITEAYRK